LINFWSFYFNKSNLLSLSNSFRNRFAKVKLISKLANLFLNNFVAIQVLMSISILLVFRIGIANIRTIFPNFQTYFTFILHSFLKSLVQWKIFFENFRFEMWDIRFLTRKALFYRMKWLDFLLFLPKRKVKWILLS